MEIRLTYHAMKKADIKGILLIWIEEAIKYPDITIKIKENKYVVRKMVSKIALEVVYIKENYIKVVTVYWV